MSPLVLEVTAEVLEIEFEEFKIHPAYSKTASYEQFLDYKSEGDTRVVINGNRHYRTPYGALPSVTTILSAVSGNKAALERWAKKNPGGREAAAARGTAVHGLMENYLLGIDKDPVVEDPEIASFWQHLPEKLSQLGRVLWAENPVGDNFNWTRGSDNISRVWHPGTHETETWGWAGAPDIVAEWKGKIVLGDLKTSNNLYYSKFPIAGECPKEEYGKRRAGYLKYEKCMKQLGAYSLGLEHTIGVVPEIFMIFVATQERAQVFAVQGGTLQKWQNKWLKDVEKYYTQIVNQPPEIDFEVVDGDA